MSLFHSVIPGLWAGADVGTVEIATRWLPPVTYSVPLYTSLASLAQGWAGSFPYQSPIKKRKRGISPVVECLPTKLKALRVGPWHWKKNNKKTKKQTNKKTLF